MTIRCPRCRKKHDDPAPERCGCGESLLNQVVARRRLAREAQASPIEAAPAAGPPPAGPDDNQW